MATRAKKRGLTIITRRQIAPDSAGAPDVRFPFGCWPANVIAGMETEIARAVAERPRSSVLNTVSGRVVLGKTHSGIPELVVVLFDVDPGTRPEEMLNAVAAASTTTTVPLGANLLGGLGDRLGSVLTGPDGAFTISFDDDAFRIRHEGERRPDLLLLVLAPEAPGRSLSDLVLFVPSEVRQNAGRAEAYFIELTPEQLTRAGVPLPEVPPANPDEAGDNAVTALEQRLRSAKRFFDRKAAVLAAQVAQEHDTHATQRSAIFSTKVKESLSRVDKDLRESARFVKDEESVRTKVLDHTRATILDTFITPAQKPRAAGFIYLTEAEVSDYQQFLQGDEFVLPGDVVERDILPRLYRSQTAGGTPLDFLMDHPAVRLCMRQVRGDITCGDHGAHEPGEGGGTTPATPPPPVDPPPADPDDVFLYVARQMQHAQPPEGVVAFGVKSGARPTAEDVGEHIGKLQLQKGPADSPSYFDFHTLQIAFEHVWKEATDQGILEDGEALYDEVVGTGVTPTGGMLQLTSQIASTVRFLKADPMQAQAVPGPDIIFEFPDAVAVWPKMTTNEQIALTKITHAMLGKYDDNGETPGQSWKNFLVGNGATPFINKGHLLDRGGLDVIGSFRQKGQLILDNVYERIEQSQEVASDLDRYGRAASLAGALNARLRGRYSFTYFAADAVERSINFGILLTYRQKWEPIDYQAGELVRTIPLAPKEVRKYSKRTVVKKTRSQKEIEDNLRITKTDTSELSRAEAEIINKAMNKNTFSLSTDSTFDIPLSEKIKIGSTVKTNQTQDAQRDSSQTKKDFRESVIKAAQEFKTERRVEITTESTYESEVSESGEITNPNDELTVTYLFYELQRQFRINERLHRMRPVILVAQEMPAPHEIDDAWILRHDWMLKRVLLDDSFGPAFECVIAVPGVRLMITELERTVLEQRKVVKDLRQNVKFFTDETGRMSRLMQAAINKEAAVVEDRDFWDGIPLIGGKLDAVEGAIKGVGSFLGMGKGDDPKEAQRIRREGVKDAYERADRERRELLGRLEQELGVLNALTRQVAEKRKELNEKEILIARLKNHLKDHILHYMQAIWSYEHPDQRFFRLFSTKVPIPTAPPSQYNVKIQAVATPVAALDAVVNLGKVAGERKTRHQVTASPAMTVAEKTLEEVAELDNLLGFKGNYMIFPLKQSNALTDFMMTPYVDSEFGLLDPDAPGNWSLEEFEQLYCCLKAELGDRFSEVEEDLKRFYRQILQDPLRPGEIITVPTGSLFIEALPGEHPVLEDFKALHRAVDVKKAQAEVRKIELENARYAARMLNEEREDPEIERKILVEGGNVIVSPDPS
jgi:hypothetical protein